MAYLGQFDDLVREEDRGLAIQNTRTIAVFDDGLVVCAVSVYQDPGRRPAAGLLGALIGAGRPSARAAGPGRGDEEIRSGARSTGSCVTFADTWPKARLIPLAVIDQVVLTRPRQVSELAIYQQAADPARPEKSVYLGDLSADRVRDVIGPLLGDRLIIRLAG